MPPVPALRRYDVVHLLSSLVRSDPMGHQCVQISRTGGLEPHAEIQVPRCPARSLPGTVPEAFHGKKPGTEIMHKIPFLKPNLVKKEAYLGYLSQIDETRVYSNYGPLNGLFEQRVLEEYFRSEGALTTVNNATIGLMLAISHTKRPEGRYALMPSFTFPATPLAAMWCGLEPYFIDIRHDDWCMDESILAETLNRLGNQTACVVTYATFGTCLNLSRYEALHRSGTPVIIDAASSFGASSDGKYFGQGFTGPVVYSFHATKTFGIGEGGLVYSDDFDLIGRTPPGGKFRFLSRQGVGHPGP